MTCQEYPAEGGNLDVPVTPRKVRASGQRGPCWWEGSYHANYVVRLALSKHNTLLVHSKVST